MSAAALEHSDAIEALAPSLASNIGALNEHDAAMLDYLALELEPSVSHLPHEPVRLALEVAYCAHLGQFRRSGEAFITQ